MTKAIDQFLDGDPTEAQPDHQHPVLMLAQSCLGFEIGCETLLKGGLAVGMAFVLFVGSVLIVLAAVFGRRMGYLVLAVSFFGWMILLSSLWTFGFYSQGLDTPVNLGPRGRSPRGSSRRPGPIPSRCTPPSRPTRATDGANPARTTPTRRRSSR